MTGSKGGNVKMKMTVCASAQNDLVQVLQTALIPFQLESTIEQAVGRAEVGTGGRCSLSAG